MPNSNIPDREPIGDRFTGIVGQVDQQFILSAQPQSSFTPIAEGEWIVRYGIPYLGKPQYSIVPDLVVLDYGDMLVGEAAWEFLINQSNLYPRSDVLGYRNDGLDEMLVIKQLDFAIPFDVLVYKNDTDHKPIAKVTALIAPENEDYPERLLKYLPRFDTLADWEANRE